MYQPRFQGQPISPGSEDGDVHSDTPIQEEFSDCFGEIAGLKKVHQIEVKEDVPPVVVPVRKIPFALKPKVKEELQRMVTLGIREPVEKPTEGLTG